MPSARVNWKSKRRLGAGATLRKKAAARKKATRAGRTSSRHGPQGGNRANGRDAERQQRIALSMAFRAMRRRGLIARQRFACCLNCGVHGIREQAGGETMYAFYHIQDEFHRRDGDDLYVAYGAVDEDDHALTKRAGEIVAQCLRDAGLTVEWNGEIQKRIMVKGFGK